jgi:hypothetical protein
MKSPYILFIIIFIAGLFTTSSHIFDVFEEYEDDLVDFYDMIIGKHKQDLVKSLWNRSSEIRVDYRNMSTILYSHSSGNCIPITHDITIPIICPICPEITGMQIQINGTNSENIEYCIKHNKVCTTTLTKTIKSQTVSECLEYVDSQLCKLNIDSYNTTYNAGYFINNTFYLHETINKIGQVYRNQLYICREYPESKCQGLGAQPDFNIAYRPTTDVLTEYALYDNTNPEKYLVFTRPKYCSQYGIIFTPFNCDLVSEIIDAYNMLLKQ